MNLNAVGAILLADNATDRFLVLGSVFISTSNHIDIASAGSVNFGSLGMVGSTAVVYEDSATHLDGTKLEQLELHARDSVTQSGVDTGAGTTVLQIAGAVHVSLHGSLGNIDLYRASSNPPTAISDGRLLDNQIGGVFTADGIKGDFRLRNASPQAAIGLLVGTFDDLTLWHTRASIVLPNQDFHIFGDLELIAGVDVHDPIPLSSNPIDRILNGNAGITDSGSRLNVSGDAHFAAAGGVTISDALGETLVVATGSTSIVSLGGGSIVLGQAGTVMVSELGIYSKSMVNGHLGDLFVQVDSSVSLINPSMPMPDGSSLHFTANNASIEVIGDLTNRSNTDVVLGGELVAVVTGGIRLADNLGDTIHVAGLTELTSISNSIELGHTGTVEINDIILSAMHGNIEVGGIGRTELGIIEARGIDVSIQESTSMVIRAAIASNRLLLSSDESILNTVAFVPNGSLGISARDLGIEAGTFAHLGPISVDRLTATVHANGTLNDSGLFSLNTAADQNGQSYLDAVEENLPPNVTEVEQLLSGESLSELRSLASFVQSFEREYGLFVQNNQELVVDGITAMGDGIHVLIETTQGTDLIVGGLLIQRFTQEDAGGMVLIAGDQLKFTPGAELRIEHISQDVSTSRAINQPGLIANAFDAGRGPAGYESTRDLLYASDASADSGTQNVLQRVSTQFGVNGESGFQTLIRYADGSSQLFDVNQELSSSLQSNPSANSSPGVIPAYASSAGDAAVVERNSPYSNTFLGTFQTLPTSAIFRRSSEFFLFEQGGVVDASVTKVDLTPALDLVEGVLSPARKIGFSLPTEIIVSPTILVAPVRTAPDVANAYPSISNDFELSGLSDAKFEVFIVKVGFDDANRDGQPSDPELPTRDEVQIDSVVSKSKASEPIEGHGDQGATKQTDLRPGDPNALTKEIRGSVAPSAAEIENWIEEYRDDPTKPSGAYAIISVDSVTGPKVLKVFGVRDFEAVDPNQSNDDNAIKEPEGKPDEELPVVPQGNDKTSSASQQSAESTVVQFETQGNEQINNFETGIAAGTLWMVSNEGGNRFGRLARSLRALRRIQSENQNDPVS